MAFRIANTNFNPTPKRTRNWTERLFDERPNAVCIPCKFCQRLMYIPPSQIGQRSTCSKVCANGIRAAHKPVKAWGSRLSEKRDSTVEKACGACGVSMHLPPSKANRAFCSKNCQSAERNAERERKTKACETCGDRFFRKHRRLSSRFCSQACNTAGKAAVNSSESQRKARENRREAFKSGRIVLPRGDQKPNWKGGPEAYRQRYTESGKSAAATRAYRRANPDKIREFTNRRNSRKRSTEKLPRGTIATIRQAQGSRCAICRIKIGKKYHVDHIYPLARGGLHVPSNLQLLCAPCNLHKGAKDPIEFMQSIGRLL